MASPTVVFDAVWKRFRRGEVHNSLRDLIPAAAKRLFTPRHPKEPLSPNDFWAVRDATFEVRPGEALGIIGANGAGKSTTLKLLTRILKPTRGYSVVRGRVGALIEVAAAFHPDLTGRENIYLQGAIMGMKRREIRAKLESIIDFAGVEEFIDTPIKRYSSGMNARLGFAIAAHMDPDVLLIDEVLAVGDLAFQDRCYQRMQEFRRAGAAIVFVSHNLSAISALCDRVALFEQGRIVKMGPPAETVVVYTQRTMAVGSAVQGVLQVLTPHGQPAARIAAGTRLQAEASIPLAAGRGKIAFSLRIRRVESGELIYLTTSRSLGCDPIRLADQCTASVQWQFNANFARGHYIAEIAAFELAHRRELLMLASAPISINEEQSEHGVAYTASSCEVRSSTDAPVLACVNQNS